MTTSSTDDVAQLPIVFYRRATDYIHQPSSSVSLKFHDSNEDPPHLYPGKPELAKEYYFHAITEPPSPRVSPWDLMQAAPEEFWNLVQEAWYLGMGKDAKKYASMREQGVKAYCEEVDRMYEPGETPVDVRRGWVERREGGVEVGG